MTQETALFRVITLNANGIRAAARKGFFEWMKGHVDDQGHSARVYGLDLYAAFESVDQKVACSAAWPLPQNTRQMRPPISTRSPSFSRGDCRTCRCKPPDNDPEAHGIR